MGGRDEPVLISSTLSMGPIAFWGQRKTGEPEISETPWVHPAEVTVLNLNGSRFQVLSPLVSDSPSTEPVRRAPGPMGAKPSNIKERGLLILLLVIGGAIPAYAYNYAHLTFPSGEIDDLVGIGLEVGRALPSPTNSLGNREMVLYPLAFGFCAQFPRTEKDTLYGDEVSIRYASLSFPVGLEGALVLQVQGVSLSLSAGLSLEPTFYLYHRSIRPLNAPADSLGQSTSRNDFFLYIALPLGLRYHLETFNLDLVLKLYLLQFHSGRRPDIGGEKFGIGVSF